MVADGGTGKMGKAYRYYNCHNAKQKKKCNVKSKATVPKAWLEDIVMGAVIEFINNDNIIVKIVDTLYELQNEENTTLPMLENQLKETNKLRSSPNNVEQALVHHI